MAGARFDDQSKQKAYNLWRKWGHNIEATVREMGKEGVPVTRQTIYLWMHRYRWKERAAGADNAERVARGGPDREGNTDLVASLEVQKAKYDRFFQSLGEEGIDVQATYAYTTLIKAIADARKKASAKPDLYSMAPVVMDEFVRFIKGHAPVGSSAGESAGVEQAVFDLIDRFFEEIKPE